ncbi:unnamed protein product [Microthlaspi erraticum]|uniref:F-box domain-containing protein n=1 Tax=Microthlaspi erraticum TaxID=1685480 RepID=A0A6D2KAB8_9BRAS|nr:unnamed protein product [Microthlaspi erraticum]
MELLLPDDVLEHILERLHPESLMRFKCVSKKWASTIESTYFKERQLTIHSGGDPLLLLLYMSCDDDEDDVAGPNMEEVPVSMSIMSSPRVTAVKIPTESTFVSQTSCDGLVCVYSLYGSGLVANPTTRWSRSFPPSRFQERIRDLKDKFFELEYQFPLLGFGKDNLNGTFKPVFLYNNSCSEELGLDKDCETTCEVFDFSTNAWRYVFPASPVRVIAFLEPMFHDGSLHWFTEDVAMCSLSDRLCVSQRTPDLSQLVWSFASGNMTWAKLYHIDHSIISSWFGTHAYASSLLSVLALPSVAKGKKPKLLLYDRGFLDPKQRLVLHDPETKSCELVFEAKSIGLPLC